MGVLKQIAEYLYLRKPDPNRPKSQWVRYMHGINRLSIILFILALIIIAKKLPIMLEASKGFPNYQFVVAKAASLEDNFYSNLLSDYPNVSFVTNIY